METFFDKIMPSTGKDISSMLMSPGASKHDVIRFDKLLKGANGDGIHIVSEPKSSRGPEKTFSRITIEALNKIETIQATTQNHIGRVMETMNDQQTFGFSKKHIMKLNNREAIEKLHEAMHSQATKLLEAQVHMNLYSVTVTIANRVANTINEGIKTLYRQQG